MPVNSCRADYDAMKPIWSRLRDCNNGRDAVLLAGATYVPNLPGTDYEGNKAYRQRGNFYNALSRTVTGMNGSIFQDPPEVEFPKPFEDLLKDITLTNVPFESFAADAGKEVILMARFGVLVDMPAMTSAEQRPYIVGYRAEDIINWRTTQVGGDDKLTLLVLREYIESEPSVTDEFATGLIHQYRVLQIKDGKCVAQLWREKVDGGQKEWVRFGPEVTAMRKGTPLDFIPFVFLGALHATPKIEQPPLKDLCDVNLAHWRNSVDHEYGLHLVALPTPWVSGPKAPPEGGEPMKIGPSVVWELEVQGTAGMLEFSGAGLASIVVAMDEKKKQMATLGARLLEDAPTGGAETATAVRMRHGAEHATLKTIAGSIEMGLSLALKIVAWWAGTSAKPMNEKVNVELNKEYLNVKASPQEMQVALTMLQAGEISYDTFYNLLQSGGWSREGVDAATEKKEIQAAKVDVKEPKIDPALSSEEEPPPVPVKKIVRDSSGRVTEIRG